MTKADLVREVAEKTGFTKSDTGLMLEAFLQTIKDALKEQKRIDIRGLGSLGVKMRKARQARNPRTGEAVPVPKRYVPVFKASRKLKAMVAKIR